LAGSRPVLLASRQDGAFRLGQSRLPGLRHEGAEQFERGAWMAPDENADGAQDCRSRHPLDNCAAVRLQQPALDRTRQSALRRIAPLTWPQWLTAAFFRRLVSSASLLSGRNEPAALRTTSIIALAALCAASAARLTAAPPVLAPFLAAWPTSLRSCTST